MKKICLLLVSVIVALSFSCCSDNTTKIPTYPVEKGEIEINGVKFTTDLYQALAGYINTALQTPMVQWTATIVAPNNAVQGCIFQCTADPIRNADGVLLGFKNPFNGQKLEEYNFQLDIKEDNGPIFPQRLTYVRTGGTATVANVNIEKGTMDIVFDNLTFSFQDQNYTFNGTYPFAFEFVDEPKVD